MRTSIVFVLMVLFASSTLTVLPAAASDYTLGIFGNANMDDTIDEDDIEYVEGIIEGTNERTELADADYDGEIDEDDITQIEQIISGEEKELTLLQYIGYPGDITEVPITIPMPVEKIVAIGGAYGPKMLCAFGELDRIVGVLDTAKKQGELKTFLEDKPLVGRSTFSADLEKVIEQKPDIVLGYSYRYFPEYEEPLKASGIPFVQMDFSVPEKYSRELGNLGWILGDQERAEELINFEQQHLDLIKERVEDLEPEEKPRVYYEWYKDYQAVGPRNANHNAIVMGGGVNIFEDTVTEYPDVESETIIERDPQVIIKCSYRRDLFGYDVTDTAPLQELRNVIMSRTGWDHIDAVENGRVYLISTYTHSTHPSVYYSYIGKYLHPQLFEDIDPKAIQEEWFQKFLGVDYQGMYAYPPLEES